MLSDLIMHQVHDELLDHNHRAYEYHHVRLPDASGWTVAVFCRFFMTTNPPAAPARITMTITMATRIFVRFFLGAAGAGGLAEECLGDGGAAAAPRETGTLSAISLISQEFKNNFFGFPGIFVTGVKR